MVSIPTTGSPEPDIPCTSTELTGPPLGIASPFLVSSPLKELRRPEATVFFVSALLLATRWMMNSGAITFPSTSSASDNLSEDRGHGKART